MIMMKRYVIFLILLMPVMLMAQSNLATSDKIAISSATLQPGGAEVKVVVSLDGNEHLYTGYEMDITLPEGVEMNYYKGDVDVAINKNGGLYPYTEDREGNKEYTHSVTCSYGVIAPKVLRLTCTSTKNESFTAKGGALFTMYLKASSYCKPGAVSLGLSNCVFATYDVATNKTTGYTVSQTSVTGLAVGRQGEVNVSVPAETQWATLVVPFNASLPEGLKAYTCNDKDDAKNVLVLRTATSLAAFHPYIVYSETGYEGVLSGEVQNYPLTRVVTEGYLNGALTEQTVTTGYVLQNLAEGVKFYNADGNAFTIPAGKCWVSLPSASSKAYGFAVNDPSGIESVTIDNQNTGVIYNLNGQHVNQPMPNTIYIKNGKKYVKR